MIKSGLAVTVVALIIALSNGAFAQQRTTGNTATNASRSGGPGTHVGAERTGSASNNEKVLGNHNGYSGR
jgi:hypothetical protein